MQLPDTSNGPDPSVYTALLMNSRKRAPERFDGNVLKILRDDPRWAGRIRLNLDAPWIDFDWRPVDCDVLYTLILAWIEDVYKFAPSRRMVRLAVHVVASMNAYEPTEEQKRYPGRAP